MVMDISVPLVVQYFKFAEINGSVNDSPILRDQNKGLWEQLTKKRAYVCKVRKSTLIYSPSSFDQ
jgi:hypothetical protein